MALSGKYDFKGIKKTGAAGIRGALASTPALAWTLKFGKLLDLLLEFFANWLANKGLIVLNLGAYKIGNYIDGAALEKALENGIAAVESGRKLTPEEIKRIDDEVIKAADKALPYGSKPTRP